MNPQQGLGAEVAVDFDDDQRERDEVYCRGDGSWFLLGRFFQGDSVASTRRATK